MGINKYEKHGTLPSETRGGIADLYAYRSVCLAQQDLRFPRTRACINTAREGAKGIPVLFVGGVVACPVGFCAVVVCLPFKWWRTAVFSDDQLDEALRDLRLARQLGYTETTWHPMRFMLAPRRKHLDQLGFTGIEK